MWGRRTLLALVVLKRLEASKGSTPGYKLMAEAGLVFLEVVVVVDLLVRVLTVVYRSVSNVTGYKRRYEDVPQKPIMEYVVGLKSAEEVVNVVGEM